MEKLIELLNEYEKTTFEEDTNWVYEGEEWKYYEPNNRIIKGNRENKEVLTQYELCSKQFGFIKWLVKNDKIDLKEFHRLCGIINQDSEYWNGIPPEYEQVIMYLSISDSPIEDLVSLLK